MGTIKDFNCTYDNSVGISAEITEKLNLTFPDAYLHWESISQIALEIKKSEQTTFCLLPFCHTLEAEAMGGSITLGNGNTGPRAKDYTCTKLEELLELPEIDYESGRIAENLKACQYLSDQGEKVVFEITGPFTILNVLMDARYVFRYLRKKPETMMQVIEKLGDEVLRFAEKAVENGASMISYADSTGGLNILGPKNMEFVTNGFTYPFLKKAQKVVEGKAQIILCPKTTFALLGTEKMVWKDIPIPHPMQYVEACMSVKDQAVIVGQTCLKDTDLILKRSVKAVQLV